MIEPSCGGPFSVYQFFHDGSHERLLTTDDPNAAVEKARDYVFRPAAKIGFIKRVIITDRDDFTLFDWKHGEGVVFPPVEKGNRQ